MDKLSISFTLSGEQLARYKRYKQAFDRFEPSDSQLARSLVIVGLDHVTYPQPGDKLKGGN